MWNYDYPSLYLELSSTETDKRALPDGNNKHLIQNKISFYDTLFNISILNLFSILNNTSDFRTVLLLGVGCIVI